MQGRFLLTALMSIVVLAAGACNMPGIGTSTSVFTPTPGPAVNETIQTDSPATAVPTIQPEPSETITAPAGLIAYVGADGNVWLLDRA